MVLVILVGMALAQGPSTPMAGTVVAQDGSPVVGADLVLTSPTPGESPVVARGKSGEGGKFRFDRPAGLAPVDTNMVPTLWAVAPGHRAAVIRFARNPPSADEPVRVVLGPPARTEVRVETPDGKPLVGARVNVQRTKSEPMPVPDPVADLSERTTGPDGAAVLDAFGPEEVGSVDVIAKGFGTQPRWFDPTRPGPKVVRLMPVVPLKGRLVAEKGPRNLAKGWRVRAWTRRPWTNAQTDTMAGYGETTTDDEGRFALPEIAPGSLSLAVIPPCELDLLPELPVSPTVDKGRENVLAIPLRRPSTVTGMIVEQGTGKPVVEMGVILFRPNGGGHENARTDAQGRYTFKSLAGTARVWAPETAPVYVSSPSLHPHDIAIPQAQGRVDLGTTELLRAAPPLKGEVRDETGKGIAGVVVKGHWNGPTPLGDSSGAAELTTDRQGRFVLEGLAPGAKVTLIATLRDRETVAPVVAVAGADTPVIVQVLPRHLHPSPPDDFMGRDPMKRAAKRQEMLGAILARQKPRPAAAPGQARPRLMMGGANFRVELVQAPPPPVVPPLESEDDDQDEVERRQPEPLARPVQNWVVAPEAFDQFLFEGTADAASGRALLDAMLEFETEAAVRAYGLTPAQQAKLRLAGRGGIKLLFDRVEDGRREFNRLRANHNDCMGLFRELQPLRVEIRQGPFFAGSLYSKALTKMIAEGPSDVRVSGRESP